MGKVINFNDSEITRKVEFDGISVRIDVYSDSENGWLLEIVDEHNNSTCWDEPFSSAKEALEFGLKAIEEEGIQTFVGVANEKE